jgi:hypothetical protein
MGCNFADFDNDGFLDIYFGTGTPPYSMLVPNRMFKNVEGKRFADITLASGTGHLQKGHGVACGDWRHSGLVDLFVELGGATSGDRFRNVLFENPGQGNHSLTVKLVGRKTNRAAIGARIKAVVAGPAPNTFYRHVTSGSSFGANPLRQTVGLGKATTVERLEIYWPTSGTTQVFRDVPADRAIEITEFAKDYRTLYRTPQKGFPPRCRGCLAGDTDRSRLLQISAPVLRLGSECSDGHGGGVPGSPGAGRRRGEVLNLAQSFEQEGLESVVNHLRRARNEVVWKLGE